MKIFYSFIAILLFSFSLFANNADGQITVSGAVAGNGTYASLTNASGAFNVINTWAQNGANIVITVTSDVNNETGAYSLNAGAWASLTIIPGGGMNRSISGTVDGAPLINFNGADYVTIDGLNTGGNSLRISNLSTSSASVTSTIRYYGDASNNTITNCTILGSATIPLGMNGGNIFISTGNSTGNDNITISNCNIGPAGGNLPSKLIYGNGSAANQVIANSNITISNCNMYDFFLSSGCAAVYALTGNTDWSVSGNKIFQTSARTFTAAGTMSGIYFANATYGDNIQITGNTIGYANSSGTGTFTIDGNGFAVQFQGIYLYTMPAAATACSLNSNIISDISFTSSTGAFTGIYNASSLSSNTININGNQIKSIGVFTTTGNVTGIYAGAATVLNCNANTIDNISRDAGGLFYGIQYYIPATVTFSGNTISNLSSTSTTSSSGLYGIYSGNAAVDENVSGNSIYNLTSNSTNAQSIAGWYCNSGAGNKTAQNNNIYNLSAGGGASIYGIRLINGTAVEISGNSIHSFSGALSEYGIYAFASASTDNIFKNKIYDLSSINASAGICGIYIYNAVTTNVYNNYISDFRATASNLATAISGVYVAGGTATNLFYNTIFLNAASTGTPFGTSCLYASTSPAIDLRNNIFVNLSIPNGTSGYTTAYRRTNSTLTTYSPNSNNNCFYSGTPGTYKLIMYNGNSYSTIASYKSAVAPRDSASVSECVPFVNAPGNDLHINPSVITQIESGGIRISAPFTVTSDFDGDIRWGESGYTGNGTAPDIGADEGNFSVVTNVKGNNGFPSGFFLSYNYPNPFNPYTKINYSVPIPGFVDIKVFDILGREVKTLVNEFKIPGYYSVGFICPELPSGVYIYRMKSDKFTDTKTMMIIK